MNSLLEEHSYLSELEPRHSCLVCRHYRIRDGIIYCVQRSNVHKPVSQWNSEDFFRCVRRSRKCKTFDDMRPTAED